MANRLRGVYLSIISVSAIIGTFMRPFYDWTGADQSRASPVVLPIAIALLVVCVLFCLSLPWIRLPQQFGPARPLFTFQLRRMIYWITAIAMLLALARYIPAAWITGGMFAVSLGYWIWLIYQQRELRLGLFALFAAMYFPFLWTVESLREQVHLVVVVGGLPAFLPTALLGAMIQSHAENLVWFMFLFSAAELLVGCFLFQRQTKFGIGYAAFLLLLSTFGSFLLHSLMRM